MSRRTILKLAGATTAMAILNVSTWRLPGLAVEAVRSEWTFSDGIPAAGVFETPILTPDTRFDSVDLSWLSGAPGGDGLLFEVRTRFKDGMWSEWSGLHVDGHSGEDSGERGYVAPVLRTGVALQARVTIAEGSGLREFMVCTLDTTGVAAPQAAAVDDLIDGFIIPRSGWGADETLRHVDRDPKKPLAWPPEYQPVEKIILHHTATDNNPPDVEAALRAVYYYHAITREWGDIGYNFLIDAAGNVYEGRFGGPNVIAGHSLRYNAGSTGISLLGNFDLANPPKAMIDAFVRLVRARAGHVDVTTASDFVDLKGLPNLCGHGDVLATSCPGDRCRPLLPAIRGQIAGTGPINLAPPVRLEWLDLLDCQIGPSTVHQGNLLEVRLKVRNAGSVPLETTGAPPGYVYDETADYETAGFPKIEDTYRFALDFDGNTGIINPFRWGFGTTLAPGEERDVAGYVRMKDIDTLTFSVSIVKEYVHYLMQNGYPRSVVVLPPPTARATPSNAPGVRYFSETGHNVPPEFDRFWSEQGGLRRFGYPLTEAFDEVSVTDGGVYRTQYFERARFELHPEYAGTKDHILLGLVGVETTADRRAEAAFLPIQPISSTPDRFYFPETRHSLGGFFKRAWEERGGLPIFGYPISEEFQERSQTDGVVHVVQYFERNRFEYHPDYAGTDDEVMLGHLAREILIRRGWLEGALT
ncbi:MAG TPA: N-acetylmuramoyl-L-alanine amidase [Thermomicrobiales bacterium]|nr:N-acetylmuramoyl-L-alanine amidase [Thermomicrobiales bacterium]